MLRPGMTPIPVNAGIKPRVAGGKVLYLDFDGVLHHEDVRTGKGGIFFGPEARETGHKHVLFEHCHLLESLLEPYPDVRVVLSTTWAKVQGFTRAKKRLTPELEARVVGSTFHSGMDRFLFAEASRGMQIWSDVCRRTPVTWLAIDDDVFGWPEWCRERLIPTPGDLGLSDPAVFKDAVEKFESAFAAPTPTLKSRTPN